MSLSKKAVRGGLWMACIRYTFFFVQFAGNLWLARILVPEDFGLFALAMSISEIIFMLGGFGFARACIQLQNEPDIFDTGLILTGIVAVGLTGIGLTAAYVSHYAFSDNVAVFLAVLSVMKLLQMPSALYLAYLEKDFSFRRSALIPGVSRSIGMVVAIALAMSGWGMWCLLIREVTALGLVFLGSVLLSPYKFNFSFNRISAGKIIRFSFGIFFVRMSEVMFGRVPNLLMGSFAGITVLGYFERSLYVPRLVNVMLSQLYGKVGFAVYSKVKDQPERIGRGLELSLFWLSRIVFLPAVFVFLYPRFILTTMLGEQWEYAAPLFQGFALFVATMPLFTVIKQALLATGKMTPIVLSRVVGVVIIGFGALLAWLMDRNWAIIPWSMSIASTVSFVWLAVICQRQGIVIRWTYVFKLPLILSCLILIGGMTYVHTSEVIALPTLIFFWGLLVLVCDIGEVKRFYAYMH